MSGLDDLDDLLNEVEGILQAPSSRPGVAPFSTPVHKPRAEPERRREFDAFSAPSKLGARGGVAATPLGARGTPARFGGAYAADSLDAEVDYDFDSKTTPRRAPGAVGAGPGAAATPRGRPAYPAASAFGAGAAPAARAERLDARRADPGPGGGARFASGPAAASARPRPDGFPPSDRALSSGPRGGGAGVASSPASGDRGGAGSRAASGGAGAAGGALSSPLSGGGGGPPGSGGRAGRGGAPAGDKVLLGGADCTPGDKPSSLRKVVSASLRCTRCAQAVLRLPGAAWQPDVGYMHFREVYPDLRKLGAITLRAPASAAYCCQCTWKTVEGVEEVSRSDASIRWVNACE